MPGIDSLELIRKARKQHSKIRTIMISGNTMVDIITPMHRKSIDDYIPKPFKIFDLKKAVKQAFCTHCKSVLATI